MWQIIFSERTSQHSQKGTPLEDFSKGSTGNVHYFVVEGLILVLDFVKQDQLDIRMCKNKLH